MAMTTGNQRSGSFAPMSEINVTPFVDVMLVLLVIFMVTAPMMMQGLDVSLPQAQTQAIDSGEERIMITLTKNKKIFLGEVEVPASRLEEVLATNDKLKKDKELDLQADKSLPYGFIVDVMAKARAGGAQSINMVTDPNGAQ